MTLILDAGPLISLRDAEEPRRSTIRRLLEEEPGELILPAPVSAEVDYLLSSRGDRPARRAFLADLAAGRFRVVCLEPAEYALLLDYDDRYTDVDVGLADLSVAVLAHRFKTNRVMTFDERHFRVLRPVGGGSFVLLPQDEA